jgi:hypothetical protein
LVDIFNPTTFAKKSKKSTNIMNKFSFIGLSAVITASAYNFTLGKQDFDNAQAALSGATLANIAQTTSETESVRIKFAYDAAGNRISRTLHYVSNAPARSPENTAETEEQEFHSEVINKIEIRIFPNPTQGMLKVEIDNLPSEVLANIALYDFSGRLIEAKPEVDFSAEFNLTSQPAGIYIMRIIAGEERTSWKIIKQ